MAVDIEEFRKEVYNVVASIPSGRVLSYGQIAWLVGCPRHARLVGKVLHGVSEAEHLPCHRVVNGNGRYGSLLGRAARFVGSRRDNLPCKWLCRYEKMAMETGGVRFL